MTLTVANIVGAGKEIMMRCSRESIHKYRDMTIANGYTESEANEWVFKYLVFFALDVANIDFEDAKCVANYVMGYYNIM